MDKNDPSSLNSLTNIKKIQALLIKSRAVQLGDFTLASGAKSSYYIDVKTALTDPVLLATIGYYIAKNFQMPKVVAGVAVGGIPLAVAVSMFGEKPYAIIRKEDRNHGKKDLVIGDVKGKSVMLVEDVTTSGQSSVYGIKTLRDAGAHVDWVVTVVDREQGAKKAVCDENVLFCSLVTAKELMNP